jgi:hypothetical protein
MSGSTGEDEPIPVPENEPDPLDTPSEATAEQTAAAEQEALFAVEPPPLVPVEYEGVTTFGWTGDLQSILDELGDAEDETPARPEAEAAEEIAATGVPEGADDDADAVEALLDAEKAAGLLKPVSTGRQLSTPFFIYDGVWLLFSIAMVAVLAGPAQAGTLDTAPSYPVFVFAGLALTAIGPLLALIMWGVRRSRVAKRERTGLLAVALLRGSLATFGGVVLWWIALIALNYIRTGRFF